MITRSQHQGILATIVLIDADLVEHLQSEGDHAGVVIFGGQLVDQLLGGFATAGVDFQQAIAALFQPGLERFMQLASLGQKRFQCFLIAGIGGQQLEQLIAHRLEHGAGGRTGLLECIQTVVIPELQGTLGGAFQIGDVDLDRVLLADTIETTDTLFQQIRVERQIEQHQVAGKLEVATLGADLGAEQHLGAPLGLGEIGGGLVPLQDGHPLVEHGATDPLAGTQRLFQGDGGGSFGADHQYLLLAGREQQFQQPVDAGIELGPAGVVAFELLEDLLWIEVAQGAGLQIAAVASHHAHHLDGGLVLLRQRHGVDVEVTLREALNVGAAVAKQHAAGAVLIQQLGNCLLTGGGIGEIQSFQLASQDLFGSIAQGLAIKQLLGGARHLTVGLLLGEEGVVVVEALGIQQTQAGKVALVTQLIRGCGQQQHAGHLLGQRFHHLVGTARGFLAPLQVMRLIDDQQIPLRFQDLFEATTLLAQEVEAADHQLFGFEGILRISESLDAALLVKQGEVQVEAAQHLDKPLVLQGFGQQDQHAMGAAGEQLLMDDHARFDGLAEAHFVSQQYARGVAVSHFVGNIKLVRDQADFPASQTAGRIATALVLIDQGLVAQGKAGHAVDLPGEQTVLRLVELDKVVEKHLFEGNGLIIVGANTYIYKQAVFLLHFFDRHGPVFVTGYLIAHIEADPGNRRLFFGIHTVFTGSRKQQGNHASFNSNDSPQTQIRLCITNPTLAKCKRH